MDSLASLSWTSRFDVARSILAALADAPTREAWALADLLAALAPPELAPELIAIARRLEGGWQFRGAVRALGRLATVVPEDLAIALVEHAMHDPDALCDAIRTLRPGAGSTAVLDRFDQARLRGAIISYLHERRALPAIFAALWARWRRGVEEVTERDLEVALAAGASHASAAALVAAWPRAVDEMLLPAADLLRELGPGRLRSRVREAIAAASLGQRCPLLREDTPGAARRYAAALSVVRQLPLGRPLVAELLGHSLLSNGVFTDLLGVAFEFGRAAVLHHALERPAWWGPVLALAAAAPAADALELAHAAQRSDVDATAYHALVVLDASASPLAVCPSTPLARLHAAGTRARRGDAAAVEELATATGAETDAERAEAIRWLGASDGAADHAALFDQHLRPRDDISSEAAEQAAIALARALGHAARTPLLRAYIAAESYSARANIAWLLDVLEQPDSAGPLRRRAAAWSPFPARTRPHGTFGA